ncbi:hypothetical protein LNN85_22975 [Klebsiella pneumoniae subsp. pneumoniae]|nr:hypothetical protein [Klebsiella pneumoniae subsp. pneumoniae]
MKKLIVISAFIIFALSPPAISKQITSHLKMVDGYFNGILTANDDEPIWFGILEFDFFRQPAPNLQNGLNAYLRRCAGQDVVS